MPTVTYKGNKLAQSEETIVVFPPSSVTKELFVNSDTHTTCGWKGVANYYTLKLQDGSVVPDAAWFYPETKEKANNIRGYIAFYKNKVEIV